MIKVCFSIPDEFIREANKHKPAVIRISMGWKPSGGGSPMSACLLLAGYVTPEDELIDLNYFCGTGVPEQKDDAARLRMNQAYNQLRLAIQKDLPECEIRSGRFVIGGSGDER